MRRKNRMPAPFKPALPDASIQDKGVVVSLARYRWKLHHLDDRSENQIRMMRFIWMRDLRWEDRWVLHGGVLGALLRAGLAAPTTRGGLRLTVEGEGLLDADRKAARRGR